MGLGDLWNPNLHPRGFHGRFIKKFKLAPWLDDALKNFAPRQFQSQGQANQFAFNQPKKIGKDLLATRRIKMDFDEAADHLRNGDIDPTTQKFMAAIDPHFEPAPPGGLILSRTFGPEALGLGPEHLVENDPNGIEGMMGNTLQDKMYSPTHLGQDISAGPGKITMRIATPGGTPVAYSGTNPNDPGVYLNRDQKLLVTQVSPDGRGGWFMSVVAEPPGATSGSPVAAVQGRKGAGLNPAQREARIGGPSVFKQAAPPPSGDSTGHQLNIPGQAVEPGPPQTPEQRAAAAPARAARQAGYQQARQAEGNAPLPPQAPQPVQPQPAQNAPSVGARTEPVHGPIGGVPTEGKSASEIANTPPAPSPSPAPTGLQEGPAPAATFRQAFHDAKLEYPSRGKQRSEVNDAFLGAATGKKHPQDALRQLEADIKHNERAVQDLQPDSPQAREMHDNIDKQRKIADFMAQHFNLPREGKANAPETPAPAAPTKTFFKTVKELTPQERGKYDSLSQADKAKYLTRRRAGQGHDQALAGIEAKKAAPAKAVPAKAAPTAEEKATKALRAPAKKAAAPAEVKATEALRPAPTKAPARKFAAPEVGPGQTTRGGPHGVQVGDEIQGKKVASITRSDTKRFEFNDSDGKLITSIAPQGKVEWKRAGGPEGGAPETKAAKAVAKAVPEPAKPAAAKVAKAAPAPKAVSEVQTRADEAGLPKTVTALRAQAREQKIRGFSTMNKEQLQRALLGEEVSTGAGKLGPIAPDKLSGHIEAAPTDQAARALMEDHTVADLKALAKHNGVDLKGITRKDAIKDAVIKHIRGEGPGALRPEPPKESLLEGMAHNKILAGGLGKEPDIQRIVAGVKDDDPNALRSGRDELEKIAEDTKTSDPIRSRIAQEAADAMGMRAQQISGVEEAPKPVKAAKVAKKAAAPKLSVHQERVRKQALADGATEEEARAAGEAAPVRAPAGTKAASAAATKARKAAGLPESRQEHMLRTGEFVPGPQQTVPKRAPKAATPAKAPIPEGPGRVQPQGVREAAAPGDLLSPESTRKLRAAGLEPGVPGKGRPGAPEAAPAKKVTKSGIPAADEAKFKAAGVKPNKVVPQGSVKGERAQTPIDNNFRAHEFDAAYMKHVDKRSRVSDSAIESQDQIAGDISEGRITPEEGIRRIESEIAFNNDEIQNLHRDIRSGNLEGAQLDKARSDLNQLERDNASHEKLSRDLHNHFGKERVTVPEVKESIANRLGLNVGEMLKKTDAEELKRAIHENPDMAHLGEIKGNTGEEVFDNAIKAMITHRLNEIAAEKEGKKAAKVAKKAAPRAPRAAPAAKPEFERGGPKHLDAGGIAEGLDVKDHYIDSAQRDLDQGKSPAQVAKNLRAQADMTEGLGVLGAGGNLEGGDRKKADAEATRIRSEANGARALADRIEASKRPTVRKAAAAKAAEDIAAAKEETPKGPARKALNQAEKSVKEAGDEAQALKARIVGRHRDAWDKSTTRGEAEAAAEGMRKDLLLSEIREFFGKDGITGRSKDDILKKAVERRFGSGGDISPEVVKTNAARTAVNNRMEESARLKKTGGGFARLDEILANGGSERAVNHRVDNAGLDKADTERLRAAAHAGDRAELDRIAQEHGLTRNTGNPGDIEPFEPGKHRAITGSHRKGDAVRVIQPGYQGTVEGRAFQAHPATVLQATPEEKQAMLTRLANDKNEAIKNLPAETRAAVLARVHRQGQNPVAKKAAARARAAKGIPEPAPLPTSKAEEVAGNMARLEAAKAVKPSGDLKAAAPEAPKAPTKAAKAVASKAGSGRLSTAKIAEQLRTVGSTEEANKLIDTNLPRSKAQYRDLAEKVGVEVAPNDTMAKMHDKIVRQAATRRLEHAAYLRRANPVTSTGAPEHGKLEGAALAKAAPAKATKVAKKAAPSAGEGAAVLAKGGFNEPFIGENKPAPSLPTRGPIKRAHVSFDENTSPATFGRADGNQPLQPPNGRWSADQGLIHMDSEIGELWKDLASDNRLPNSDLNKITKIGQDLGQGKISTKQATTELNGIRNGLTDGPVKDRFTEAVRALDVKPTEYSVPDNTPKEVRDWLDNINAIPAFHDKAPNSPHGQETTPFERAVALVRDIGEGRRESDTAMKLRNVANNVHESGDGVYQARNDTDRVFFPSKASPEIQKWLRTPPKDEAPKAPAKATKAAKKAAPAKVTQAELKNPVAKVGKAAPSATPSQVQATGLKAGEGIPTSPMLLARNKLGSGNAGTLTKLDTAVRIPARHSEVPGLLRDLQEQLQRAGVGPDDEPRKSLVAWFREHFKV